LTRAEDDDILFIKEFTWHNQSKTGFLSLSRPQLSCGVEALAGEFRLKAPLQVIPCGLLSLALKKCPVESTRR